MSISDWFRKRLELDAESSIELGTQERIIHVTGRHYIVLIARLVFPILCLLVFGGLAVYRALSGGFLVFDTGEPVGFDGLNLLLIGLIILLTLVWLILWVRGKSTNQARTVLIVTIAALAVLTYFRYGGGRVFYLDPVRFGDQGTDLWNILLISLALASTVMVIFTFYDWLNDELIVTNQRVIYDNDQVLIPKLIEQRAQQQIFLEDVQDVSAATSTYPQHWLKFGTITVKSARFNGNIVFESAKDPMRMQSAIMGEVRALRKTATTQDYGRLVAERVYGDKGPAAAPARPQLKSGETRGWRWLRRIVPANPEIDEAKGEFVWRPHWLFLLRAMIGPLVLLLGGLLIVLLMVRLVTISPLWIALTTLILLLAVAAWTAYEIEDYTNDKYILSSDKVVDIEKKPFGPESRKEASLGQVNNVASKTTYLSNLLGYGDVELSTAGSGPKFTFERVPRPADVVGLITEYNVRVKRADKYKPLNDSLELLRYYHNAQVERDELNRPPA